MNIFPLEYFRLILFDDEEKTLNRLGIILKFWAFVLYNYVEKKFLKNPGSSYVCFPGLVW